MAGKKKRKKAKTAAGAVLFDQYYAGLFGDRWAPLREALSSSGKHMELRIAPDKETYYLDQASWIAARALPAVPGMRVLDLCAAPGGKSLILAEALRGTGSLTCNELSPARRNRLKTVLADHLPDQWRENIQVTGYDGSRWCLYEKGVFDAVLLDAPCSSERHLLHSPVHLNQWSPARTKHLAVRQYSLAVSALDILKPGGWLLYSTCSLSPLENDGVIERMRKKRQGQFLVKTPEDAEGERTAFGRLILPDRGGWGPLYYCLLQKAEADQPGDSANL